MDGQEEAGIGCYLAVSLPKRNTNSAFATWPQFQPHHSPVPLVPTLRIPAPSLRDPHAPCSPSSPSSSLCAPPPARPALRPIGKGPPAICLARVSRRPGVRGTADALTHPPYLPRARVRAQPRAEVDWRRRWSAAAHRPHATTPTRRGKAPGVRGSLSMTIACIAHRASDSDSEFYRYAM